MQYVSHIESSSGERFAADAPLVARPGETLEFRYHLDRIAAQMTREHFARGPASIWRYAALLPLADPARAVTLGEGWTPLIDAPVLARRCGVGALWLKDEGRNPSGTFKDRGAAVAISRYRELGVRTMMLNSSGNAGGSWSLYAARAGVTSVNLLPTDAQPSVLQQCRTTGQPTLFIDDWHQAGAMVAGACELNGWLDVRTLKEPCRLEGKKTMGLEIAEQLGWTLPDALVYPMGGGLGALAIYKAFEELRALGWVEGPLPRLIITQYAGCAPLVKAFDEGRETCETWGEIDIPPGGLKSPNPLGGPGVLELLRTTGGGAFAVTTADALAAADEMAASEGVFPAPECATTLAGLRAAQARGLIGAHSRVVLVITGSGLKSIPTFAPARFPVVRTAAEVAGAVAAARDGRSSMQRAQ